MSLWDAELPYNDLPAVPNSDMLETRAVLKAAANARAAVAALNQAANSLPNPAVLINTISLLEAQASSEIENIVTTSDDLFKFAGHEGQTTDPATREALQYRRALYEAFTSLRSRPVITPATAIQVCSTIKMRSMNVRTLPGTFIGNPITHKAIYTPPEGESIIRDKLDQWANFLNADSGIDPLVRMSAAHYQFEAIHPFEDGNGRTGRVLNVLSLVADNVLALPILYLSSYIINNKNDYYRLLLSVTSHGAWEDWLLFMLSGVQKTADLTLAKIEDLRSLQIEFRELLREHLGAVNADLLEVLFEQPYCRTSDVVGRCGVSRQTAGLWLRKLVQAEVLTSVKEGRERLYINNRFLKLLQK